MFIVQEAAQTANTQFTIEFFSNTACDPSSFGEGETFIGSTTVMTDGSGDVDFAASFGATVPVGKYITATATDPDNNTSEFSQCVEVTSPVTGSCAQFESPLAVADTFYRYDIFASDGINFEVGLFVPNGTHQQAFCRLAGDPQRSAVPAGS